jgi:hypothetical protein
VELHSSQFDPDAEGESGSDEDGAREDPSELIDKKIRCLNKRSGQVVECVVVDYISSLVGGDYFVVEDGQGKRRKITLEELAEMRVD